MFLINPYSDWAFLARPWTGGGCLKTIKDIDMKLTPLIKRREINLLLLSYFSCEAILDFRTLSKRCQNFFFRFKFVE